MAKLFAIIILLFVSIYGAPMQPVLLVPGIGGSVLYNNTSRVWVTLTSADYYAKFLVGFDNMIKTSYNNSGLDSIRNLDPDNIFTSFTDYFNNFIVGFIKLGYVPGVNLFGFPYDWRLSITDIAKNEMLCDIINKYRPIVITHSFGGLVIEEYIRQNSDKNIIKIINIGVPFKGAGGNAIKVFDLGYNLGNFFISNEIAKEIALKSFSTYELLPQPSMYPMPIVTNNTVKMSALDYLINLGGFDINRYYVRTNLNISIQVYYIANSMYKTPYDYIRSSNTYDWIYVNGDGTVPIESAFNSVYHNQPIDHQIDIRNPNVDHFGLLSDKKVFEICLRLIE